MLCPYCQWENPDGSKFCIRCGKRIGHYCMRCHASLPAEAQFCSECGNAVVPLESSVALNLSGDEGIAALKRGERIDFVRLVENFENQLIDTALRVTGGNRQQAAELLGIKRTTLVARLRRSHNQD